MKRAITTALCTLTLLCGIGQSKHYDLKVGTFDQLVVTDNINVVYHSDTQRAGTVVFDCPQNIADGLIFNNNTHGKLTIQVATEVLGTPNLPTLHAYSADLSVAENAGDSTLTVIKPASKKALKLLLSDNGKITASDIEVPELELLLITGKGLITASGYCQKLKTQVLGKGTIDAMAVSAQQINCRMMGTGAIDIDADGAELNVRGSGTGHINYLGTPSKIKVRKLGPLKVTQMDP
ncbi:MAG: DUF2807 domain-containing protein [Muribaculaceae bacterium]|nr:DUF2807 domain-containing protein [Muribaculaceae bacterium]